MVPAEAEVVAPEPVNPIVGAFPNLLEFPPVKPDATETFDRYRRSDDSFTTERQELHDRIVAGFVDGAESPVTDKTVYMMGGGPASGKGSLQRHGLVNIPSRAVAIDPDEVKKLIPEYSAMNAAGDFRAAAYAHEESSMLAKRVVSELVDKDADVFLDGTGDGGIDKFRKKVAGYRKNGHRIVADYVTIDTEEAIIRSDQRGQRSGRFVPHSYIEEVHAAVSDVVPKAMSEGLYDELRVWDNMGEKPVLVADFVKGRESGPDLVIEDQTLWESFLGKAK